ncbi:ABC transporter permease [Fluviispira multicolorata]|uniref:ABC transporter permease n=1 Tax=Fluviispira multicolorata TaxID=2654512 RepID=A0A833JDG5_9BACT|nr:ABC transporter permease [Fluviispira multicolorata]KAB8030900.1 ABC transporter permease [Fluviispira multicolorata]
MNIIRPIAATIIGLFLGLLVTFFAGENPLNVFLIFATSGFGSTYDFGMTLTYSMPLILTGLSVSMAFKSGLFNIGAEGQLTMGALAAATAGALFTSVPAFIAPIFAGICAALAGGIWGGIAGYLKAKRGAHEVITTIMLNFIAAGIASYVTVYLLKDPNTQNPQTIPISPNYKLETFAFFDSAPVSSALFLSVIVAILVWIFLYRTPLGYEIRAVGSNESAASTACISISKTQILNMFIAGSLAGLVGVGEVLSRAECFKLDFSPGYGFTGIAVAFLARGNPIAIIFSGFLFGALQKGASDLEIFTHNVTSDLSLVLQALIILAVSADGLWEKILSGKKVKL